MHPIHTPSPQAHASKHSTHALPEHERQRCEVWTRVMGYHRPTSEFNPGKQSEHRERRPFIEPGKHNAHSQGLGQAQAPIAATAAPTSAQPQP